MSWKTWNPYRWSTKAYAVRAELSGLVAAVIALMVSIHRVVATPSMLSTVILIASAIAIAIAGWGMREKWRESSHENLTRPLEAALEVSSELLTISVLGNCRITVHVRCGRKYYTQAVPYAGRHLARALVGRKFRMECGIVGKAFKSEPFVMQISSWRGTSLKEYRKELVEYWGYSEKEARNLTPNSKSWIAVPIGDCKTNEIQAVLYADSDEVNAFASDSAKKLFWAITIAIVQHVEQAGEHVRRKLTEENINGQAESAA
jgi:hypothetical protein